MVVRIEIIPNPNQLGTLEPSQTYTSQQSNYTFNTLHIYKANYFTTLKSDHLYPPNPQTFS